MDSSFVQSRPRVFVSSVVEGFAAYREASRAGIEQANGEPVLVNEDFSSMTSSSRNTCLDAVASCDIFLLLMGSRGGWLAPSGRLVVEEELQHARSRKLPVLVFLQEEKRDEQAERLARQLSDYIDGFFRIQFRDPVDLTDKIVDALKPLIEKAQKAAMDPDLFSKYLDNFFPIGQQTTLRLVLCPERQEEVIEARQLFAKEFAEHLFEIGHRADVKLFSFLQSKEIVSDRSNLILDQTGGQNWRKGIEGVRVSLAESGTTLIDSNVTGRRARENSLDVGVLTTVAADDIEAVLQADFRFVAALYNDLDPYKRHQRFLWNASLNNLGYKSVSRSPQGGRSGFLRMSGNQEPLIAFPTPRIITRDELLSPSDEIARAVFSWERHASAPF